MLERPGDQHRTRRLAQHAVDIRAKQREHAKAGPVGADANEIDSI